MVDIAALPDLQETVTKPMVLARPARRHPALLIFVSLSLLMGMLVEQTTGIERGSWQYIGYVSAAIIIPLFSLPSILSSMLTRCWILLVFMFWAGIWHWYIGDFRAVAQLLLLVFVLAWLSIDDAALNVVDLTRIYVGLLLVGAVILSFTNLNSYSLIPGRALPEYGRWRVSFFPNIAYTGALSLALLMILTRNAKLAKAHLPLLIIAVYFLVFSFVRSALIALLIYIVMFWWFQRWQVYRPKSMFWASLCISIGFVTFTFVSAPVLYQIQELPLVSSILLRGESGLTVDQISYQLYRPWLWSRQLDLFLSSPSMMGWGSADFFELVAKSVENPHAIIISAGSEALPMRLLVVYGLPGLLFTAFLLTRLWKAAQEDDRWACACFPAVFALMMTWGSLFHPSDAMFAIFMLIVIRGAHGFSVSEKRRAVES